MQKQNVHHSLGEKVKILQICKSKLQIKLTLMLQTLQETILRYATLETIYSAFKCSSSFTRVVDILSIKFSVGQQHPCALLK